MQIRADLSLSSHCFTETTIFIIRYKFFFLQIIVWWCAMSSNYVCLQIIFSSCVNIEALVIFKKTQFALGAKKNERQWKHWEQEHVRHFLHKTWKPGSFWTFHVVAGCKTTARKCAKSVLQLDLFLFFTFLISFSAYHYTILCLVWANYKYYRELCF